jgi:hypothetical protein
MRAKLVFFIIATFIGTASFLKIPTFQTKLLEFKATSKNGMVGLTWRTEYEENLAQFEVEYSRDGKNYQSAGIVHATNSLTGNIYSFEHRILYTSEVFYRLKIIDNTNLWQYSDPIIVPVEKTARLFVYPSVITTRMITIIINDPFDWMQVVSTNGMVMMKQNLSGKTGRMDIPLSPTIASGIYIVQLGNPTTTITQEIMIQKS